MDGAEFFSPLPHLLLAVPDWAGGLRYAELGLEELDNEGGGSGSIPPPVDT